MRFAHILCLVSGLGIESCTTPTSVAVPAPTPNAAPLPTAIVTGTPTATPIVTYKVPIDGLPSIGSSRALVTMVTFIDYECPFSRRADGTVQKLRAIYGDDLRVVVAERPLPMHERARPAALAALAAGEQGAYEAVHAKLLAGALDEASIAKVVKESGLDEARFESDRAKVAPGLLAKSEMLAEKVGARGTPSFFINGRSLTGAQPIEQFRAVIDERLAAARELVKSGVRADDVYARSIAGGADSLPEVRDDSPSCGKSCDGKGDAPAVGQAVENVPIDRAPSRGSRFAPITIVEFADYQCPYCVKAEGTIHAVEQSHARDVRVVWKNLPLPFHDKARDMARAAIAAEAQGRFWEMHDKLLASGGVDRAGIDAIARDLGLDLARFARDMSDPSTDARLAADKADADALDVQGTPTFFVNGHRLVGAQPARTFEGVIAEKR